MEIKTNKFTCPCCGYPALNGLPYEHMPPPPWLNHGLPPYSRRYGKPSYEVCPCCGFEFGNDDDPGTAPPQTFATYLTDWVREGCVWFDLQLKPTGWNLESQLQKARIIPNPVTRIEHPELGSLHFSSGRQSPQHPEIKDSSPQWVCEPDTRNTDFEILIPGDVQGPHNLDLALAAFHHRKTIEEQGQRRGTWKLHLAWIDLTQAPPTVAFTDDDDDYILWTGILDSDWKIIRFTKGKW